MKVHCVEHGHGRVGTYALIVHQTESPAPQQRLEDILFADTPFRVTERSKPTEVQKC